MNFLKFNKNNVIALAISLLIFIFLSLAFKYTRLFDGMENGAINFRFFLRDPAEKSKKLQEGVKLGVRNPKANDAIIIMGIDEDTIRDFNDERIFWPFPWQVHAKFTKYLATGKPKSIFFDIMFLDKKNGEKDLAESFKFAKNVFIDYPFETQEIDQKYSDIDERIKIADRITFKLDPNDRMSPWVEEIVPPNLMLSKAAKSIGYANIRPDMDHYNRKMPLIIKFKDKYYPSIDLLLVMDYFNITKKDVEIKIGKYIKLNNVPGDKLKNKSDENDHTIKIPIDEEGFMDINFIGGPGSYNSISYKYYYNDGEIPAENTSLNGKIILVAAYSATGIATDIHKSPYGDTFGIEHHANAINTILNQDFLYKASENENIILFLIIALILGFVLPRVPIIWSIIAAGTSTVLFFFLTFFLFITYNYIWALSTPMIQFGLSFTSIIALRLLTEQKEKKYIRNTFSKFVSKSVVDELLKSPENLKLGGEKKILSVLFSDIRGFTTLSEKMAPEQLVEHLNDYLQAMTDIVIKYNGTLDKYVGDEIMAFWGAPIPQNNHPLLTCKAAVEMISVLDRLNKSWEDVGKCRLDIGIGINTGTMIVGNMGSTSRMDYTLIGDDVNLGARLEGTNKVYGTRIIISDNTYEFVKDKVIVRELDLIKVKGKNKPVKIFELVDLKEE